RLPDRFGGTGVAGLGAAGGPPRAPGPPPPPPHGVPPRGARPPSSPPSPIIAGPPLPGQRGLPLAARLAAGGRDDLPRLDEVERGRPPVKGGSPDREGPADDPGGQRGRTGVGAEEQQRERIQQA